MGTIGNTLQTLERVMEYKRASYDICMAASRHAPERTSGLLEAMALQHDADLRQIPLIFKHLDFTKVASKDDTPLTEIRTGFFQNLGEGTSLNLIGAVINIEREAVRLLQRPLERAETEDLKTFLEKVLQTARSNIESLENLGPAPD